jgi:hypothetical protein
MIIDLNSEERKLLIVALLHKCVKLSVQEPDTPPEIKATYKQLLQKLQADELLHMEMKTSVQRPRLLIPSKLTRKAARKR